MTQTQGYMPKSSRSDWETPQWLFERLDKVFGFDLDVAASAENAKCENYFTNAMDALKTDWSSESDMFFFVFCNPPYGKLLPDFIRKGYKEFTKGNCDLVAFLIPASTELKIWHEIIWPEARYILFFNRRIAFELDGKPVGANVKGSALVVFSDYDINNIEDLSDLGYIVKNKEVAAE